MSPPCSLPARPTTSPTSMRSQELYHCQRLDRRPADRPAHAGRRAGLPRLGDDAARPASRHRAGARACRSPRRSSPSTRSWPAACRCIFPSSSPPSPRCCSRSSCCTAPPSSTGGCAVLIVLNGPIRRELGAAGTFNALGNSDRATAVIGRAIRLALINILEVRPGGIDRSTLGHPGKFSYCVAEDEEDTTWLPLHAQRGLPAEVSAVTVMAAGAPRQIMNEWTTAAGGNPGDLRRRDARQHAALFDLGRQLCADHPQATARASASRRLEQDRHRRIHPRPRPDPPRRMGRGRQGAPWCATGATPNTRRWTRPISCWSSRPAVPPAGSAR